MFLSPFFTEDAGIVRISPAQGSAFAKDIAGDFNPIHDADNPRFCAPGDLLFALALSRHGIARQMAFRFTGMVGAATALTFAPVDGGLLVSDAAGKSCLEVSASGELSRDAHFIESLVRRYVAFSGQNFPHILVPLMEEQGVMINTDRPLVIYERMSFDLDRLDAPDLELTLVGSRLEVNGRRGDARLEFQVSSAGEPIGHGAKTLILSGLRDLDRESLQGLVDRYAAKKAAYLGAD
ncbi:hypothetical protein ThidrDRAFT_3420 [Thiorhodococcus drewsii AZ1]|uniref:DUF3581 domain-containing protein n=1 Tax=Thiorhodococcus drewsii AZ1 TaxID=765913 RepID=G2E557_9GAMM|nr:DUF3581 family protein [Thiorhodococcus drewsii]EGV28981.1 hypothetical protein ThidrDRAFT_3420 [Thiorhodococcus drewsii AZ1]